MNLNMVTLTNLAYEEIISQSESGENTFLSGSDD